MVDLGDGGSSESESTKSDETIKKAFEVVKTSGVSRLISLVLGNPFS